MLMLKLNNQIPWIWHPWIFQLQPNIFWLIVVYKFTWCCKVCLRLGKLWCKDWVGWCRGTVRASRSGKRCPASTPCENRSSSGIWFGLKVKLSFKCNWQWKMRDTVNDSQVMYVTRVNPRNLSSWKVKQILDLNSNCTL